MNPKIQWKVNNVKLKNQTVWVRSMYLRCSRCERFKPFRAVKEWKAKIIGRKRPKCFKKYLGRGYVIPLGNPCRFLIKAFLSLHGPKSRFDSGPIKEYLKPMRMNWSVARDCAPAWTWIYLKKASVRKSLIL